MTTAMVTLFNADLFSPLKEIRWTKAATMMLSGKVHAMDCEEPLMTVRSRTMTLEIPPAVALKTYVFRPYREIAPTRRRILDRDRHSCAYCGEKAATIDHIHPQSRGGKNTWENLVAACESCNSKKGNSLLSECGMKLLWEPYVPATVGRR